MPIRRPIGLILLVVLCALGVRAQSTSPALVQPLPAQSLTTKSAAVALDLTGYFGLPGVAGQVAQFDTVLGKFNIELLSADAPLSVANFLKYVNSSAYSNSLINRSVPGFVIQGGGFTISGNTINPIIADAPVQNEFKRSNVRGTLAFAKIGGNPNSATNQWFVNLVDNSHAIDATTKVDNGLDVQNGGFTVFARVLGTGMSVVDAIAALQIYDETNVLGANFASMPLLSAALNTSTLVIVRSINVIPVYPSDGSGPTVLTFTVANSNAGVATASLSGSTLTIAPVAVGSTTVTITATDTNGNTVSGNVAVTVAAAVTAVAPIFTAQPVSQTVATGSTVVFNSAASGTPAPTYQWRKNGVALGGLTSAMLVVGGAATDAGTYTCVATNSAGSAVSNTATLTVRSTTNPGRLINLSIITTLAAGESMSMGTVLGGAGTSGVKPLLTRAAGPSLSTFSVSSPLPDPKMSLLASGGVIVANNDNWAGNAQLAAISAQVGAFAFTSASSKDAAIYQATLAPGNYAVQVSDTGTGTGTVLAELYDATPGASYTLATPRLVNVSVIKQIVTNDSLSAGFVVGGDTAKTVLVRAIGPGLSAFNVSGAMVDPQLDIIASGTTLVSNDNWGGDSQLTTAGTAVGAFKISDGASTDAMVMVTLPPGAYSARVQPNGGGGMALVEVYEVP